MSNKIIAWIITTVTAVFICSLSLAATINQNIKVLHPLPCNTPPKLDGVLDEDAWSSGPIVDDIFLTFEPTVGDVLPPRTTVWMTYDLNSLYFGFYCYDTEPQHIKSSITKRDNIWNDDYIAITLDSIGNRQGGYDFIVNSSGIQADGYRTAMATDTSADWVWYSSGRMVKNGYIVEIQIPLQNIKFNSGENVEMNIVFWRHVSRLGLKGSWPEIKREQGVFNSMTTVIYKKLVRLLKLEILPAFTYGSIWDRQSPSRWSSADRETNMGIGVKYGITSSVTCEVAINPDFSQVESDVFQVVTNQRYPIFYSEKRSFFMDGTGIFSFFVIPQGQMLTAVHTRSIVNPSWGAKLTGTTGKAEFGILAASDQWPGLPGESEANPYEGKAAYFTIARGKYSLGGDNNISALYSGREFAGGYNRVAGADFMYRFLTYHQINISFMQSYSREPAGGQNTKGNGLNCFYAYNSRPLEITAAYERYGKDFRMDSAFQRRTGIRNGYIWIAPKFYPSPKKVSWLKLIRPQFIAQFLHDFTKNMNDKYLTPQLILNFTRQGYLQVSYSLLSESWVNQTFDQYFLEMYGGAQLTKWLRLTGSLIRGDRIYYDLVNPYMGWGKSIGINITLQPSDKINQDLGYNFTDFYRASDDEKIYEVNIVNSRTTYQFNKYFFVRAILQYDSYRKIILTDLLASYTLIPGTVLHLGYGSLHENYVWENNNWKRDISFGRYYSMSRSFFFKVSYLFQF